MPEVQAQDEIFIEPEYNPFRDSSNSGTQSDEIDTYYTRGNYRNNYQRNRGGFKQQQGSARPRPQHQYQQQRQQSQQYQQYQTKILLRLELV